MSSESSGHAPKPKRTYRLKARAVRQQATRGRIAAAAAKLHEEVGPARTTIAEVARRAGVGRPTVYNNFPDERELLAACQAHFLAEHPPPDAASALALADPLERLRGALEAIYRWYRETEAMTANVQRDRRLLPNLDALLGETSDRQLDALADELAPRPHASGQGPTPNRPLTRLALEFSTWQRLTHDGLSDSDAAELMAKAAHATGRARAQLRDD